MVEGSLADQDFVGQNPQAPQIHRHVILGTLQDLRGCIVKSATVGLSPLVTESGPTKVTELTDSMGNYYVFGLDVSVRNIILVEVLNGRGYFLEL
jgi:hypothetical protein